MGKYFTIDELCRSNTADKMGIRNVPSADIKEKLEVLINELLDPVREAWGKPIRVNSGYRCPKLNKAVGGVANSQHMKGEAADLNAGSKWENKALSNKMPYFITSAQPSRKISGDNVDSAEVSHITRLG